MSGDTVRKVNPFDSEGTIGRAIFTGGLSVPYDLAIKETAPDAPPSPQDLGTVPSPTDAAVAEAQAQAEAEQRKARGRAANMLYGTQGYSGSGLIAKQTLLGS